MNDLIIKIKHNPKVLLYSLFAFYIFQSFIFVQFADTGLDEGHWLMRSWWYVNDKIEPYSVQDPTFYMPIWFWVLGIWQKVWGIGHLSGRILSAILGFGVLQMVFLIGTKIYKDEKWGVFAVGLLVLTPVSNWFHNITNSYSFISLIQLIIIWILINKNRYPERISAVLLGLFYFILYFTRQNMVLGILPLLLYQFKTYDHNKYKNILITLGTFFIFTSFLYFTFKDTYFPYYVFNLPTGPIIPSFIREILVNVGAINNPFGLIVNQAENIIDGKLLNISSLTTFFQNGILLYLFFIVSSMINIAISIRKDVYTIKFYFSLYFIWMFLTHWFGSHIWCAGCITPYTNYFLCVGALGSTGFIEYLFDTKYDTTEFCKGFTSGIFITAFGIMMMCNIYKVTFMLSDPRNSELDRVNRVKDLINRNISDKLTILPIDGRPFTVQGAFLAGNIPELTSINQYHSYRYNYKNKLFSDSELIGLRNAGFWTDQHMEKWIKSEYEYILMGPKYKPWAKKYFPMVDKYFTKLDSIDLGLGTGPFIYLYKRELYSN